MANPQLVTYIKSQLAAGVVEPEIQKALIASGWSVADASAAFVEAKAPVAHAPASAPAPKPVVPAQPMQAQQPVQTFRASPLEPSSSPMTQTTMQMNVRGETHRGRGMLLSILIPIVLLAGAAAGAYFFVPQVRDVIGFYLGGAEPVVEEPVQEVPVVAAPTENTYTNAQYGFSIRYPLDMRQATDTSSSPADTIFELMPIAGSFERQVLSIQATSSAAALAKCSVATSSPSAVLGVVTFALATSSDTGLGQSTATDTYKTSHNGVCITLRVRSDGLAFGHLDAAQQATFSTERQAFTAKMNAILQSFMFTSSTSTSASTTVVQ